MFLQKVMAFTKEACRQKGISGWTFKDFALQFGIARSPSLASVRSLGRSFALLGFGITAVVTGLDHQSYVMLHDAFVFAHIRKSVIARFDHARYSEIVWIGLVLWEKIVQHRQKFISYGLGWRRRREIVFL